MHFSQKTLDFLLENRLHDSKAWFEEHRAEYQEYVLEPLRQLVEELTPAMLAIDVNLVCEPKIGRSISRIYRDTRFSKDKSIFREVMWCVFARNKTIYYETPGFFAEISPYGFRYGCGYYQASPAAMEAFRKLIVNNDQSFTSAFKAFKSQEVFVLEGDMYKRSRYPQMNESIRNWLDRKNICFISNHLDFDIVFSDTLVPRLVSGFKILEPMYSFMLKAEGQVINK